MSPRNYLTVRLRSLLITCALMAMTGLGVTIAPVASADVNEDVWISNLLLTHNCIEGQAVTVMPGDANMSNGTLNRGSIAIYDPSGTQLLHHEHPVTPTTPTLVEFQDATGLPLLNPTKQFRVIRSVYGQGESVEFNNNRFICTGNANNEDGDLVPDEKDQCRTLRGPEPSGCPNAPVLTIDLKKIKPSNKHENGDDAGNGSVTLGGLNPTDAEPTAEEYFLYLNEGGEEDFGWYIRTIGPVPDGGSFDPVTVTGLTAGSWRFCLHNTNEFDLKGCATVTVPASTTQAYAGKVTYHHHSSGLYATLVNNGWKPRTYTITGRLTWSSTPLKQLSRTLQPGQSFSLSGLRRFDYMVVVRGSYPGASDGHEVDREVWKPPPGKMTGGNWYVGRTNPTVTNGKFVVTWGSTAFRTQIGVRVNGSSFTSWKNWYVGARKDHKLTLGPIPRGKTTKFTFCFQHSDDSIFRRSPHCSKTIYVWRP